MKETYSFDTLNSRNREEIESRFRRRGTLTRKKLLEYIPVMIMTNMSVFLLSTVDGIVAGNLVSEKALSSINVFFPAMTAVAIISALVDGGTATSLATSMGKNDIERIRRTKSAVRRVMILAALVTAVVQFPIIYGIISSYHLSPEVRDMAWQYAVGINIALPLGLISSVGAYQLQIIGRMRVLMMLSITESVLNIALDVFFVEVMHLGILGIGFGTAGANIVRCSATVGYLLTKTDMYRCGGVKPKWSDIRDILKCGLPDASNMFMVATQNYFMMSIILSCFGDEGAMIRGVCFFAYNIANVMILGMAGSMRPLAGLFIGAGDKMEMRILMRNCMIISAALVGIVMAAVEFLPALAFRANGVINIPDGGILSLQLFALHFIIKGINALFRLYLANRKDSAAATVFIITGSAMLPIFAFALGRILPAPFIWLAYMLTESLILVMALIRYRWWMKRDWDDDDPEKKELYLSIKPHEAVEASRMIRQYAKENGIADRISFRMSLCMEEMVWYAEKSQKDSEIEIQVLARFGREKGTFVMMDNGRCIELDEDTETRDLITDNYTILKKVSKSVEYQYILNMNHTVIRF